MSIRTKRCAMAAAVVTCLLLSACQSSKKPGMSLSAQPGGGGGGGGPTIGMFWLEKCDVCIMPDATYAADEEIGRFRAKYKANAGGDQVDIQLNGLAGDQSDMDMDFTVPAKAGPFTKNIKLNLTDVRVLSIDGLNGTGPVRAQMNLSTFNWTEVDVSGTYVNDGNPPRIEVQPSSQSVAELVVKHRGLTIKFTMTLK